MKTKTAIFIGLWGLLLSAPALAGIITIQFEGYVTQVFDRSNFLNSQITSGTPFSGYYSYDSSVSDSDPDNHHNGSYHIPNQSYDLFVTIGDMTIQKKQTPEGAYPLCSVGIGDNDGPDPLTRDVFQFSVLWPKFTWDNTVYALDSSLSWYLSDTTASAIGNDSLWTSPPVLTDWQYNYFSFYSGWFGKDFDIQGTVTFVTPEPISLAMIALGGSLLLNRKRMRQV